MNYLQLANAVLSRLNETQLTASTFPTVTSGFSSEVKDAINRSIDDINTYQYNWPWNLTYRNETLVVKKSRYALPADYKIVDWDSFRIVRDTTQGVDGHKLSQISYGEYLKQFSYQEDASDQEGSMPYYVWKGQGDEWGISPMPDKAYVVRYEYFALPTDLSVYTDTPTIPTKFHHVIVTGAMYYAYMFRENTQAAQLERDKFLKEIESMREINVNYTPHLVSTRITGRG